MPTIFIFGMLFVMCMAMITITFSLFGKEGLYIYSVVAIIASNIQVLKAVKLVGFTHPVPLGDVVFTSLFLVSDIITECWGKEAAKKGVWLGFAASIMFSLIMILVVGIAPLENSINVDPFFIESHNAMALLFTPSISIVAASLIAYFASLWCDIFIFNLMKIVSKNKYLWLRTIVSSVSGIIIDTIVFSSFAWVIFAVSQLSLDSVVNSYMINAIKIRILLAIFSIPVFYLVKKINNKAIDKHYE